MCTKDLDNLCRAITLKASHKIKIPNWMTNDRYVFCLVTSFVLEYVKLQSFLHFLSGGRIIQGMTIVIQLVHGTALHDVRTPCESPMLYSSAICYVLLCCNCVYRKKRDAELQELKVNILTYLE